MVEQGYSPLLLQRQMQPQMQLQMQPQMQMRQQLPPQPPGASEGFIGGLLDSAVAGLLPNTYLNPQDPSNMGAAKAGGLLGMIVPILLAKWGLKNLASKYAAKGLEEGGNFLSKWLGNSMDSPNALAKLDMLSSIGGGLLGGTVAEGPLGGLLGAAALATHSNFLGPGAVEGAGKYQFGKLFDNLFKKTDEKEIARRLAKKYAEKNTTPATQEEIQALKNKYEQAKRGLETHGVFDIRPFMDDASKGFDSGAYGNIKIGDKIEQVSPRTITLKAFSDEANTPITFQKLTARTKKVNGKEMATDPKAGEFTETTWKDLYADMIKPVVDGVSAKNGKWKIKPMDKIFEFEFAPGKATSGSFTPITQIENNLQKIHKFPLLKRDKPMYGDTGSFKRTKTTTSTSSASQEEDNLSSIANKVAKTDEEKIAQENEILNMLGFEVISR
jgi:hypothetical protein